MRSSNPNTALRTRVRIAALLAAAACASARGAGPPTAHEAAAVPAGAPRRLGSARAVALPGSTGVVHLDYLAAERERGRAWVPAGETGRVDVVDGRTGALTEIPGFPTREGEVNGRNVPLGPSSVALGDGVAFVGSRADGTICAVDARSFERRSCASGSAAGLPSTPDGIAYVAPTREVWATLRGPTVGSRSPGTSILVLDAADPRALAPKGQVALDGIAEGYAVDASRGRFYTNLEDRDRTVAIDVRSRRVVATWEPRCGPKGPRGVAVDTVRNQVFVACTDKVVALDGARPGTVLAALDTGAGVDNIDYLESRQQLFVAAGSTAMMTVVHVDPHGLLAAIALGETARGARTVVADADGRAYVADPAGGRVLVFDPAP